MELVEVKNNEIIINNDFIEDYKKFKKLQLEMELKEKEVKLLLKNAMEMTGKKRILKEGFSVTYKNNKLVKDINDINIDDELNIKISNGEIIAKVTNKKEV